MKLLIVILSIFIACSISSAADLQLLNHYCLDKPVSSFVGLFFERNNNEIEPYMIMADIKLGKYTGASVFYENVTFDEALRSLNKLYKSENISFYKESKYATWPIKDKRYAVNLVKEAWGVMLIYVPVQEIKKDFQEMLREIRAKFEAVR
jgi:hypothetical protein